MRIKYLKYFSSIAVLLLLTWTISCSGRSGEATEAEGKKLSDKEEATLVRLIKMISPEENSEFRLHSPIHVDH
jgi:hypothetical protein